MPIMRHDENWPMHTRELYKELGVGHKLPDNKEPIVKMVDGWQVTILPRTDMKRKKHRVVVQCAYCDRLVPFGRLRQHEKACLRKDKP